MAIDSKWTQVATVPPSKLKTIPFGALKGKSDINPQWRIKAMTEVYGLCGIGWYHELNKNWTETAPNGTVMAFCLVNVYIKVDGEWSKPICGMGGNEIVSIAKEQLKQSDEGWKMAYTDALGTALKSIGVASEIYEGNFDGSKYQKQNESATMESKDDKKPETKEKINLEKLLKFINDNKISNQDSYFKFLNIIPANPETFPPVELWKENLISYKMHSLENAITQKIKDNKELQDEFKLTQNSLEELTKFYNKVKGK